MQYNKVVWHEGMFLQPQHLQQLDRSVDARIHDKFFAVDNNLWGFTELTLDLDLLSVGKLGVRSCSGIFPDGTLFDAPQMDEAPAPLVIEEGWKDCMVYLAIPIKQSHSTEVGNKDADRSYRYNIITKNIKDYIADNDFESEVPLASTAIKIVTEHEDLSEYTYLPITKIIESRANHQIKLDDNNLNVVWLNCKQCKSLSNFVVEVHDLLNQRAEMLSARLLDTKQTGAAEVQDMMILQLVNRYEPLFHHLRNKSPLHPEVLFRHLIQLMGDLATFTATTRRPIEPPQYLHNDLLNTFKPIVMELRRSLNVVLEQNAVSILLENRGNGYWVGTINDKQLLQSASFILAIYAELPPEQIKKQIQQQIKVAPTELIQTLVSKALPGIPVNALPRTPSGVPYYPSYVYFGLSPNSELWEQLTRAAGIAFHITEMPGLKLELWAVKG